MRLGPGEVVRRQLCSCVYPLAIGRDAQHHAAVNLGRGQRIDLGVELSGGVDGERERATRRGERRYRVEECTVRRPDSNAAASPVAEIDSVRVGKDEVRMLELGAAPERGRRDAGAELDQAYSALIGCDDDPAVAAEVGAGREGPFRNHDGVGPGAKEHRVRLLGAGGVAGGEERGGEQRGGERRGSERRG